MPNFGPPHKMIVHKVGEPYEKFSTEDFADFEVVHPPECPRREDNGVTIYECGVAFNMEQGSTRFSLHYVGTPVTEPGEYTITAWSEVYRGFDYTEHDGGIALVS